MLYRSMIIFKSRVLAVLFITVAAKYAWYISGKVSVWSKWRLSTKNKNRTKYPQDGTTDCCILLDYYTHTHIYIYIYYNVVTIYLPANQHANQARSRDTGRKQNKFDGVNINFFLPSSVKVSWNFWMFLCIWYITAWMFLCWLINNLMD